MSKQNGFWGLTDAELDGVRNEVASAFGIETSTVVNH
jgi:hypothetical protein